MTADDLPSMSPRKLIYRFIADPILGIGGMRDDGTDRLRLAQGRESPDSDSVIPKKQDSHAHASISPSDKSPRVKQHQKQIRYARHHDTAHAGPGVQSLPAERCA